jgi:hypothetical protein
MNPDYARVPNFDRAEPVMTLDARQLDARLFESELVARNRPCLIKGAASHWPACSLWRSAEYLAERSGKVEVTVHTEPVVEADPLLIDREKLALLAMLRLVQTPTHMRFAEFLERALGSAESADALFFLYSVPLKRGGAFEALREDVGGYHFLKDPRLSAFGTYPRNNVYFYRSSLTDWHFHLTAEALQTQVLGSKEVLLLPPSELVWSYLFPLQQQRLYLHDADFGLQPQAQHVVPYRALLEPGDALYIPTFWWHFVSTRGNASLGATVPTWWRPPAHIHYDLRFPAYRALLRGLAAGKLHWRKASAMLPRLALGTGWAWARRQIAER